MAEPTVPISQVIRSAVRRNLTYYPDLGLVYYANAKAGASTMRQTLWRAVDLKRGTATFAGNPRGRDNSPAQNIRHGGLTVADPDEILGAVHFSVVRHPLVRLVSGYLDKIRRANDNGARRNFFARYKLPADREVSFEEFVDLISGDVPHMVDRHFRRQSLNICYGAAPLAHIGQLEDLSATARFLEGHGVAGIESFRTHSTGASDRLREVLGDPAVLRKAIACQEDDFACFNYAPGIETVAPLGPITPPRADTEPLRVVLKVDASAPAPAERPSSV